MEVPPGVTVNVAGVQLALPPIGVQVYVYAPVPPLAVTQSWPLLNVGQVGFTIVVIVPLSAGGAVIVTVAVSRQLFASVMLIVYVPGLIFP